MTDTQVGGIRSLSALDIAATLKLPPPTTEQQAVIEADLSPALVIAGAGSGKTETMASRVLWLLANRHVRAEQILGLTFTRKAAGELGERIRGRIVELAAKGLMPGGYDEFAPPTVATYNSFSNRIFRDNALLLGRESDGVVLGEASAWQLSRRVVVASRDDRLAALGRSVDQLATDVLKLSRALTENLADRAGVVEFAERFQSVVDLPAGGTGTYPEIDIVAGKIAALPVLVELANTYEAAKLRRGFVEYSDQVALALQLIRQNQVLAAEHREQYRVVLLDEYQDTSVMQTWLLAELFAEHPVMAVGDPNQSIYGWRGASASNLTGFTHQFAAGRAQRFSLSTSWRNGHRILDVANAVVAPFAALPDSSVSRLAPGPAASDFPVEVVFEQTIEQEADAVATWLADRIDRRKPDGSKPSAAILFRARKTQPVFIEALRGKGVPYHVLGIGGLMTEPEVADLVSALRVAHEPQAGSELVRLLAGSRWRLGVRDLATLRGVASWLGRRDYAQRPLDDELRAKLRESVADGDGGSIVDALDFVATAADGHSALDGFSAAGLDRVRAAGRMFASFRERAGLDLLDFVTFVEQELQLDIEVAANETRGAGRAAMDAFSDALDDYLRIDESASLGGFLGWLRESESRDNLSPRPEEPEAGTVQLMTIHGSKGLERDIVVVPRVVTSEMPGTSKGGTVGWLSHGALPWPFRGDAAELPLFEWEAHPSRKALRDGRKDFQAAVGARHEEEERRLFYVAVTRARHHLLLSGSFWASQKKPRDASGFLRELEGAGIIPPLPENLTPGENPLGGDPEMFRWPRDPLGARRSRVEAAAALVRAAEPRAVGGWANDLELLLDERRRRVDRHAQTPLPVRVPASRFKDFISSPDAVARDLRRPMPERPYRATRLGTLFHSWVEHRCGLVGSIERIDAATSETDDTETYNTETDAAETDDTETNDTETDAAEVHPVVPGARPPADSADATQLAALQRTFEASRFAVLAPIEVEREIHLPFDGRIIVCKIDAIYLVEGRYQVVDWKTGAAPKDAADLEEKQLQLALYRLAYARWRGIEIDLVDAMFYFVADDRIIVPERIFDERELIALWRSAAIRNSP